MTTTPTGSGAPSGIPKAWIIGGVVGCVALIAMAGIAALVIGLLFNRSSSRADDDRTETTRVESEAARPNRDVVTATEPVRQSFAIGDKVEIEASNHWVPCVVAENQPPSVMRVQCEAYPLLSRQEGLFTVDRDNPSAVRHATGQIGKIATVAPPSRELAGPAGLKAGEYACYGSGGRLMVGLGFKVLSRNRYTDLEDDNAGSFSVDGTNVTFHDGHLDGETGRNLRGHSFTLGDQAECEPY
jgi:hypothetical protein